MSEEEKLKLEKKLNISKIFLIINFVLSIINISVNNKIIKYIYYPSTILLVVGIFLLINVIKNRYKKDKTYTLTILYLASMFIQFMNIVLKLDNVKTGL